MSSGRFPTSLHAFCRIRRRRTRPGIFSRLAATAAGNVRSARACAGQLRAEGRARDFARSAAGRWHHDLRRRRAHASDWSGVAEHRRQVLQIMTNGWSAMGFGLPSAIAAKLVHPEKSVCTVVGDGGFLMTVGEIATAVRCRLNVVDAAADRQRSCAHPHQAAAQRQSDLWHRRARQRHDRRRQPVRCAGARRARCRSLRKHLDAAFAADGPVIVEAIVDSREYDSVVLKKDRA